MAGIDPITFVSAGLLPCVRPLSTNIRRRVNVDYLVLWDTSNFPCGRRKLPAKKHILWDCYSTTSVQGNAISETKDVLWLGKYAPLSQFDRGIIQVLEQGERKLAKTRRVMRNVLCLRQK